MSALRKADAERRAADAVKNLTGIDRQADALTTYQAGLMADRAAGAKSGYEFAALTKFASMSSKAILNTTEARSRGERVQQVALMSLASEIERRNALSDLEQRQSRSVDAERER